MKVIALNQQDANDLLVLITSDALGIKASAAARVYQLQAALSVEGKEFVSSESIEKELADVRAQRPHWDSLGAELEAMRKERDAETQRAVLAEMQRDAARAELATAIERLTVLTDDRDSARARIHELEGAP